MCITVPDPVADEVRRRLAAERIGTLILVSLLDTGAETVYTTDGDFERYG